MYVLSLDLVGSRFFSLSPILDWRGCTVIWWCCYWLVSCAGYPWVAAFESLMQMRIMGLALVSGMAAASIVTRRTVMIYHSTGALAREVRTAEV
jgi:hypothetical protein